MRKIPRTAQILTLLAIALPGSSPAFAEDLYYLNQNQTGFNLPGVTLPQGQDEIRAADGTTCRSAVGGNGAYMDFGVMKGSGSNYNDVATYGRVVVPLGRQAKRLNCSKLYELEVERLQLELKLLKMGLGEDGRPVASQSAEVGWANDGWTTGAIAKPESETAATAAEQSKKSKTKSR